jgi:hypothetical protein
MPARFALGVLTALAAVVVLRAGWVGQARLAFYAVTAVVAGALLVRVGAAGVTARVADPRVRADADAAAAANRALYTQRAFGVDRIRRAPAGYGLAPDAVAAGAVSAWDAPALARAATAARRTLLDGEVGFQPVGAGLGAVLVEYAPATAAGDAARENTTERTVVLLDAARADEVGRPVAVGGEPLSDAGRRVHLLAYPGAAGRLLVGSGPAERGVVGDPLGDWRVRLAHALAGRDLRLAFAAGGDPAMRAVDRRDVRRRVAALAPFFAQGRAVTPLVAADSVWYALPLYSASGSYPLSQRYAVGGADWSAFRHAATAVVNAQSGGVRVVPGAELDADARAWMRRFPGLFTPPSALPGDLARALPPATDGANVQAHALAQFGARGERPAVLRRVQPPDGADTAFAGPGRAAMVVPAPPDPTGAVAPGVRVGWTVPLLSSADRIEGVVVAVGGPAAPTLWVPAGAGAPRWQELLDLLASAREPAAAVAPAVAALEPGGRPADERRGHLRAVPLPAAIVYARPEVPRGGGRRAGARPGGRRGRRHRPRGRLDGRRTRPRPPRRPPAPSRRATR